MSNYRSKTHEKGIVWNDKKLKIKFPKNKVIISKKDKKLDSLNSFLKKYGNL